jgi:hypothetical protein
MKLNPFQPPKQTDGRSVNEMRGVADPMPPIAFYITGTLISLGLFLILREVKSFSVSFFLPLLFTFGPLVLAMLPMWFWRNLMSQFILIFAAIAYAIWFLFIYMYVMMSSKPGEASIVFFYVGPFASPFLLVICGISLLFHQWRKQD